jgi:hypothetical protein
LDAWRFILNFSVTLCKFGSSSAKSASDKQLNTRLTGAFCGNDIFGTSSGATAWKVSKHSLNNLSIPWERNRTDRRMARIASRRSMRVLRACYG